MARDGQGYPRRRRDMMMMIDYLILFSFSINWLLIIIKVHSAEAVEYIDCISSEGVSDLDMTQKPSDVETLGLELWGILSTPSLPLIPGPLWPGVVAPDRVLAMGQIDMFDI